MSRPPERELRGLSHDALDLGDATLLPGLLNADTHITIRPGEGDQHGQLHPPPMRQVPCGVENIGGLCAPG